MVEGILVLVNTVIEMAKMEKSQYAPGKESKAPSQACDWESQVFGYVPVAQCVEKKHKTDVGFWHV